MAKKSSKKPVGDLSDLSAHDLRPSRRRPKASKREAPAQPQPKRDTPTKTEPLTLLAKLGSIAVHADEMLSSDGHAFDRVALAWLLEDPEVTKWIADMGPLLPRKRSAK